MSYISTLSAFIATRLRSGNFTLLIAPLNVSDFACPLRYLHESNHIPGKERVHYLCSQLQCLPETWTVNIVTSRPQPNDLFYEDLF